MSETLFEFDKLNYLDCQRTFRGKHNQEYYQGEYTIDAASVIAARAERKSVGACSIIRLRSRTRMSFRRSWSHIREDGADVAVLWFVKRGRLTVSHQNGIAEAKAGDFTITRSITPFVIECHPDEQLHEVLHVVVPTHLMRRMVPREIRTGFITPANRRELAIAERILADIIDDSDELPEHIAKLLADSALLVISDALKTRDISGPPRQSMAEKRLQDVLRYIEVHLADSQLDVNTVAKGCGISPRYLTFVLSLHGKRFSTLIWEKRLEVAANWLAASTPRDAVIREVAYKVGFKSAAHFSRMFKRVYKKSPSEYRNSIDQSSLANRGQLAVGVTAGKIHMQCISDRSRSR